MYSISRDADITIVYTMLLSAPLPILYIPAYTHKLYIPAYTHKL